MALDPDVVAPETGHPRPTASLRTDLVTLLCSLWLTAGLFLDAWAHNNVPRLETFFTPWHAVFYSGFVATAGWVLWTCRAALRDPRWDVALIPVGYAASLVAIGVFAACAVGDLIWHQVFGIEQSINILFSPTHLGLGASMLVIVTTPLRAAWADRARPPRRLLPAVGSVALATTIVLLFLQYANAFAFSTVDVVVAFSGLQEDWTARLVAAIAVTNLVLLLPLLVLARRWPLPLGTVTLLYLPVAVLAGAVTGFSSPDLLVALVGTGIALDLLVRWLNPTFDQPRRYLAFATLVPVLTWTVYVVVASFTPHPVFLAPDGTSHATDGMIELYTGVPIVQALLGLLIGVILVPGRDPTPSPA